jgi:hypothetical protein
MAEEADLSDTTDQYQTDLNSLIAVGTHRQYKRVRIPMYQHPYSTLFDRLPWIWSYLNTWCQTLQPAPAATCFLANSSPKHEVLHPYFNFYHGPVTYHNNWSSSFMSGQVWHQCLPFRYRNVFRQIAYHRKNQYSISIVTLCWISIQIGNCPKVVPV